MRLNKTSEVEFAEAKEEIYEELYRDLEENCPKRIYELANNSMRIAKDIDQLTFIRDEQGRIMSEEHNIKRRWKEYFKKLLNTQNKRMKLPEVEATQGPIENISALEAVQQLDKMKLSKAKRS